MEGKVCGEIENDISLIQGNVDTAIWQIKDFNGYINDTFVYQSLEESFHNFGHIQNTIDNLHANIDENINKLLELHKDQPAIYEDFVFFADNIQFFNRPYHVLIGFNECNGKKTVQIHFFQIVILGYNPTDKP